MWWCGWTNGQENLAMMAEIESHLETQLHKLETNKLKNSRLVESLEKEKERNRREKVRQQKLDLLNRKSESRGEKERSDVPLVPKLPTKSNDATKNNSKSDQDAQDEYLLFFT
eukprot:GHVL01011918.1.p2 GENE.GHVL01011918.1~~GHVL01011918.1.p2  ORF type:complete len:113 (+),score=21.82 GHVL01011918.1:65-403(+)